MPLDGLPREKESLGDLGVACSARDQVRNHLLALGQSPTAEPTPPGADSEGAQPSLGELMYRKHPTLGGGLRHSGEYLLGLRLVAVHEGSTEIETGPERVEAEPEFVRLVGRRVKELGCDRVAQQRLDASLDKCVAWLRVALELLPLSERVCRLGATADVCERVRRREPERCRASQTAHPVGSG